MCRVPFLRTNGYFCPAYHNPADFVMEIASGEHGDFHKLVNAVNDGRCKIPSSQNCVVSYSNDKTVNVKLANSSSETSNGIMTHDSVIVDIELVKQSSKISSNNRVSLSMRETDESLLQSTESVVNDMVYGFPTSTSAQFWILLKRIFLTILRDPTLTNMRLVSHVIVGAIISMIFYGIGNDAEKIQSNAGCIFFTTLFTMFTGELFYFLKKMTFENIYNNFICSNDAHNSNIPN